MSNTTNTQAKKQEGFFTTKKIVLLAMMIAIAYALAATIHFPLFAPAPYLSYDAKDIVLLLTGFIFGPVEALICVVIVSLIEFVTIGTTGVIGLAMNIIQSAAFVLVGALIYRKVKKMKGAILALVAAVISMTAVMCLWNYILTPIYMNMPRSAVAPMIPTVFLPFNLIKGTINACLVMLVYKPITIGLRAAHLIPKREGVAPKGHLNIIAYVVSGVILISIILYVLIQFKII